MAAKHILLAFAVGFLTAGMLRLSRGGSSQHPQTRTWFLVSVIFIAVSGWLFWQG
jgi:hypothetical protein